MQKDLFEMKRSFCIIVLKNSNSIKILFKSEFGFRLWAFRLSAYLSVIVLEIVPTFNVAELSQVPSPKSIVPLTL